MAFKTSSERYDRLVDLTRKLTGIQALPDGYGQWEALVLVWKLYHTCLQCNDILFAALHFIKWGLYPWDENDPLGWALNRGSPLEKDTAELLALFREELISPEAEGAAELHDWDGFKRIYHRISYNDNCHNDHGPKSNSQIHHRYLESRLDHLIHSFDPEDDRWNWYEYFEEAIHFLLPSSSTWAEADWLDEGFILQELDRAFGGNFHANPRSLDYLVHLVFTIQDGFDTPDYCLVELPSLSYALAKTLWPVDTDKHVIEAYKTVIQMARENENRAKRRKSKKLDPNEFGYSKVKATGIHQLTTALVGNGTINDPAVKQLVFKMNVCH